MIAHTSAEAYHSLSPIHYIQPKEAQVLALFDADGAMFTRQQIAALTGMPINCVCGRVHSLVEAGILEEKGEHLDPVTRKHQKLLRLVEGD
jgi:hypothetical protein